jgi:hypothetical protein
MPHTDWATPYALACLTEIRLSDNLPKPPVRPAGDRPMLEAVNCPKTCDIVAERLTDYISGRLAAARDELQHDIESYQERVEGESCK